MALFQNIKTMHLKKTFLKLNHKRTFSTSVLSNYDLSTKTSTVTQTSGKQDDFFETDVTYDEIIINIESKRKCK